MLTAIFNFIIYYHLLCHDDCVCMFIMCVWAHMSQHMCGVLCSLPLLHGSGRDFLTKALGAKDRTVNESAKVTAPALTHSSLGSRDTDFSQGTPDACKLPFNLMAPYEIRTSKPAERREGKGTIQPHSKGVTVSGDFFFKMPRQC